MKALALVMLMFACAFCGPLAKKINPNYAATGTDTFYVNVLRGNVVVSRDTIIPAIGTLPCVKIDFAHVATEKIPAVCSSIGATEAAKQGYYPVTDTIVDAGKTGTAIRWTTDKNAKPIKQVINEVSEDILEP
jgi:hypothetical protein